MNFGKLKQVNTMQKRSKRINKASLPWHGGGLGFESPRAYHSFLLTCLGLRCFLKHRFLKILRSCSGFCSGYEYWPALMR